MRYLTEHIQHDLKKKSVLLSGPRQCGKTTLAKALLDDNGIYLNWDIRKHQAIIRQASWSKRASLVVLDELHKYRPWKNYLKGILDEFGHCPPLLVTGSARLETFRKAGDALTGRTFHYRLHPVDISESKIFLTDMSVEQRVARLLKTGGFPEALLTPENADRLRNDRLELAVRDDLRDIIETRHTRTIELLIELLRDRVGKQISYANLAEDLSVSPPTVKNWIEALRRLYLIFTVQPYSKGLARSLRKEPKIFFYDCAAAYDPSPFAARLENLVACSLQKFCDLQNDLFGRKFELKYFRDRDKREIDFIVTLNRKAYWAIEVKTHDNKAHPSLVYFSQRAQPVKAIQLVSNLDIPRQSKNVEVLALGPWLEDLEGIHLAD